MALIAANNQRLFNFITRFESSKPFIYYDSIGALTVGIGHMLAGSRHATPAQLLADAAWIHRRFGFQVNGQRASDVQVRQRVEALRAVTNHNFRGTRADYWQNVPAGSPRTELPRAAIIGLKHHDSGVRIRAVSNPGHWPGSRMANLPESVQIVIVDIAFNAGAGALRTQDKYRTFRNAIDANDFGEAERIVRRGDLHISSAARNVARADLLREAA